jgi:hypothetical protein
MGFHIDPRVTEEMVRAIPEPTFTDTWRPYSHNRILDVMNTVAESNNIPIHQRAYSLSDDGNRLYGIWTLRERNTKVIGKDSIFQAIFFRNSIDKSYAFGINAGTQVHICTNLTVFGKFLEFRRHTGGLDDNILGNVINRGLTQIQSKLKPLLAWHDAMRKIDLTEPQCKALAYDAIQEGVISKQRLPEFHQLLFSETHKYEPTRLFGFHEAATDLISRLSLVGDFQPKQDKLHNLIQNRFADQMPAYDAEFTEIGN